MAIERRDFITFAVGTAVGLNFTPVLWKLTDDISIWTQNWSWVPNIPKSNAEFAPVLSKLDPSGLGVRVVMNNGLPIAVEGNPDHPLSKGAISAQAVAEVTALYSPDRVKTPMKKTPLGFQEITWSEAESILKDELEKAGKDIAFVSGDETGTGNEVFSAFTNKVGGKYFMMPGEAQSAAAAWNKLGGKGRIGYDIEKADYVLMLGADALESWGTSVRNAGAFADTHPADGEATAKFVYAGPVKTGTGVVADEWIQAKPGQAGTLALGIAAKLLQGGQVSNQMKDFEDYKSKVLAEYKDIEAASGVDAKTVARIASELKKAKRPLVLVGSEFSQGAGAYALTAGLSLNLLLNRFNRDGGVKALPNAPVVVDGAPEHGDLFAADVVAFLKDAASGKEQPKLAMVYDADPAYGLPQAEVMAEALKNVPFTVSFSPFMTETAELADLIMPSPLTLERWDDAYTPYGSGEAVYGVNKPLIKPVHNVKSTPEVILSIAREMGLDLGYASFEAVLTAKAESLGANTKRLAQGEAWTSDKTVGQARPMVAQALAPAPNTNSGRGLAIAPVEKRSLGTATAAPFTMNTVARSEFEGGEMVVRMNARTARKSGLRQGDVVAVKGPEGEARARVSLCENVMNDVLAAPLGFGRKSLGKGDNVLKTLSVTQEPQDGLYVWTGSVVDVAKA
jgi:anaerobic selenocysteine-containing dehydrogenase